MLYLIIGGFGYFLFLSVFIACPLVGKVVLLILNAIIPDPLPYVDEVVMIGSTIGSAFSVVGKVDTVIDFFAEHKAIGLAVGIIILFIAKVLFF